MSMHRVVIATYGTLGDLHPYLAIARELQARGHRAVIVTAGLHRASVEAAGVPFRPLRPDVAFDDVALHRRLTEPRRGFERAIREVMLPSLRATYDDLLAAVREEDADLLLSQILVFAAPLVAGTTGVPWVSTELQPGAFVSAYDPPVLAPLPALAKLRPLGPRFHRAIFHGARLLARSWSGPVYELRKDLGLPPSRDPLFDGRHSPRLVLALFSEVLAAPQPDWPPNTVVTGFPFYDPPEATLDPALAAFLEGGEPPVVFTLGSSAVRDAGTFYEESVAAARLLGRRAVLLVGADPVNHPRADLPAELLAVPYAPYGLLFPRAAAIVHHGGVGTTGQALRAGRPMLVMPFGADQYDNAARAVRLGVARTIARRRYTARRVAAELAALLNEPRYRERAEAVEARVRRENGVHIAVDLLEAQLRPR